MSTRSSSGWKGLGWYGGIAVIWLVVSAIVVVGMQALDPAPDVVNAGYLASMLIFGFAAVAIAIIIARLGDRATPSEQGPDWSSNR